jgi:prephenate dehydratase
MKIGYLGPSGSFTEEAASSLFTDKTTNLVAYRSIPDCLEAAEQRLVDMAVVAIENSIEGSVLLTLDWLAHEVDLTMLAEVTMPIEQQLMAVQEQVVLDVSKITHLYSHPQSIAQSRGFIRRHLSQAQIIYTNSNSEAAKIIHDHPEEPWAAIGPSLAAEIYRLRILEQNVQDTDNNDTRFVVVGKESYRFNHSQTFKTSLLVTLPADFPGALHQVLSAFAWRKINLARIETRPTRKKMGTYHFFIDLAQAKDDIIVPGAIAEIEALGCQVRFLGSYPCYRLKNGLLVDR